MQKAIHYTIVSLSVALLFSAEVIANNPGSKYRPTYLLTGALDNFVSPLFHSQQTSTEAILSAAYGIAYWEDKLLPPSLLFDTTETRRAVSSLLKLRAYYVAINSSIALLTIVQHEISGHGLLGKTFERKIRDFSFGILNNKEGGWCLVDAPKKSPYLQQDALISLAGIQSNTFLARTLLNQLYSMGTHPPVLVYMLGLISITDQLRYAGSLLITQTSLAAKEMRNDIVAYVALMQLIYGKATMSISRVCMWSLLDLVNPLTIQLFRLKSSDVLYFRWGNFRIMPMLNSVLMPYNMIEKRLSLFSKLGNTPFTLTVGFGGGQTSDIPLLELEWPRGLAERLHNYWAAFSLSTPELFNDHSARIEKLAQLSPVKKYHTVYTQLDLYQIRLLKRFTMDISLAGWRQPELFTAHPRFAPMKIGGMVLGKLSYKVTKQCSGFIQLGYKSGGFMLGYTPFATPIIRAGVCFVLQ
jgi:hypothetical protein